MTTQAKSLSGRCLCGACRVTIADAKRDLSVCHCSMCRRWGGGPLICTDTDGGATLEGGQALGVFESSEWAERGFCTRCGTHLFYRLKGTEHYAVPAGLLEGGGWRLDEQIFIDEKPDYYTFAERTKTLTGAEVFAKYAPPEG